MRKDWIRYTGINNTIEVVELEETLRLSNGRCYKEIKKKDKG